MALCEDMAEPLKTVSGRQGALPSEVFKAKETKDGCVDKWNGKRKYVFVGEEDCMKINDDIFSGTIATKAIVAGAQERILGAR